MDKVDSCLGRTDNDGTYYYRTASPCLQTAYSPAVGGECSQCANDMKGYFKTQIGKKDLPVVGIAKDGHVVYGPYWPGSQAEITGCHIDVCNGFFYANPDKTSAQKYLYGYAATSYHPYGPPCFGPANYIGTG